MTMAFSFFGKKMTQSSIDYKSRFEYKLYLARENPEPVFDLSECNLKSVPSGIYSLCRVFRKEKLLLQVNQLNSLSGGGQLSDLYLLTVLDLHNNKFTILPEEISRLTNLQELNVSQNQLKKLPEAICSLVLLQVIDCSQNRLKYLPQNMSLLKQLFKLDVRANPQLCSLPDLCTENLKQLIVDEHLIGTLPDLTANQYQINKSEAQLTSQSQDVCLKKSTSLDTVHYQFQDSFKLLEKKKEERLKELLKVEKTLQEQKGKEYELHKNIKEDKTKLIMSLKEQQTKLEEDVSKFQTLKDQERTRLLNNLLEVESQAEMRISELLELNQALHHSSLWQQQDQQLLNNTTSDLRRNEVIDAMESLLAEECALKEKLQDYDKFKAEVVQSSLLRELEWGEQVTNLLSARECRQSALVSVVEEDSRLQMALVATLLERSDLQSQSLIMQVALVQQQLAVLTAVELQRRQIHVHQHLSELADKRRILSELLEELLKEQGERRKQLIKTLHQMDFDKEKCEKSTDYWLSQYQRLMEMQPQQHWLNSAINMDQRFVHQMVEVGAIHWLPLLAYTDLHSLSHSQLYQIGVKNEEDQAAIMKAVHIYLEQSHNAHTHPSAPPEDLLPSAPTDDQPSAPALPPQSDCVVCMEHERAVVFVPCGHLCTCVSCSSKLSCCPLCRTAIDRKIQVIKP